MSYPLRFTAEPDRTNDPGPQTVFQPLRVNLSARPLGRGAIVSVIIVNPLLNADGTGNALSVWVGDKSQQILPLIPGQSSPEIQCADLADVAIRVVAEVGGLSEVDIVLICQKYPRPVRTFAK